MKLLLLSFLMMANLAVSLPVFAQSLTIGAGRSGLPGDYYMLRYEAPTNSPLNWVLGIHAETSHINALNYTTAGIDWLLVYPLNNSEYSEGVFSIRPGLGLSTNLDSEPWVYAGASFSKRLNYGFLGEIAGEWFISDDFSFIGVVQQKYLLNTGLGKTAFNYGIGLRFRFSQ